MQVKQLRVIRSGGFVVGVQKGVETLGTSDVFKRTMPGVAETFILQNRESKWVDPDPTSEGVSRSAPGFDVRVGWIGRCSAASLPSKRP